GSLRRFNELFKARYRLIPSALRSGGARGERAAASGLVFHLGYRPPYDWDRMLNFLQARAVQGVE
ncbi:AlkA N-terminal domain-containing protein, partial [Morganella morganii]